MKKIELEAEQWSLAEKQVAAYLNRAGDDAWCEVWFRSKDGLKLGYRAGNAASIFPTATVPKPKRALPARAAPAAPAARPEANPYDADL